MRRKVTASNREFNTIASFISEKNQHTKCDVLTIDECSTVSNSDMRKVLEKAEFKFLVLVGDVYQIESIYFGNWFDIARNFICKDSIITLPQVTFTSSQWDLLLEMVAENKGVTIICRPLVEKLYSGRVVYVPLKKPEFLWTLGLIAKKNRSLPGAAKSLWDFCAKV